MSVINGRFSDIITPLRERAAEFDGGLDLRPAVERETYTRLFELFQEVETLEESRYDWTRSDDRIPGEPLFVAEDLTPWGPKGPTVTAEIYRVKEWLYDLFVTAGSLIYAGLRNSSLEDCRDFLEEWMDSKELALPKVRSDFIYHWYRIDGTYQAKMPYPGPEGKRILKGVITLKSETDPSRPICWQVLLEGEVILQKETPFVWKDHDPAERSKTFGDIRRNVEAVMTRYISS